MIRRIATTLERRKEMAEEKKRADARARAEERKAKREAAALKKRQKDLADYYVAVGDAIEEGPFGTVKEALAVYKRLSLERGTDTDLALQRVSTRAGFHLVTAVFHGEKLFNWELPNGSAIALSDAER